MELTNTQRVAKLISNLLANPDLIFPYLHRSVFTKKLPIDHGMPWWSFRAIERADSLVTGKSIFEFGTGGSTLRFAKSAKKIVCVEDHPEWADVVRNRLGNAGIGNVEILECPFDFKNPTGFESSDYLAAVDGGSWDIVIIDGQDWSFRERIACFRRVEPMMGPDSIIIVDDFWRYQELLSSNRANAVEVYESVGPSRIGVTSTAFFFYSPNAS